MDVELANRISKVCLEKFDGLPKTGKPNGEFEWSILSAVVLLKDGGGNDPSVVSLGTGTKCLGSTFLSSNGDVLNDSHAEVLARRGFLRYLMKQMLDTLSGRSTILEYNEESGMFVLKSGYSFHFFTTHSPCGDASIFANSDQADGEPSAKKSKTAQETDENGSILKAPEGMTGGKLLTNTASDLMAQDIGEIRTKPGKGIRTLSLSCSDKLARWNILGIQGSQLMMLLERPIYLESIVFCDGTDLSVESIERALWKRWDGEKLCEVLKAPFELTKPQIAVARNGILFKFRKNRPVDNAAKFQPAPGGMVWCSGMDSRELEVEIAGRRQGVTKKMLGSPAARLKISKIELFAAFASVWKTMKGVARASAVSHKKEGNEGASTEMDFSGLTYGDVKKRSLQYRQQWDAVKSQVFRVWSEKTASLLAFSLDEAAVGGAKDRAGI